MNINLIHFKEINTSGLSVHSNNRLNLTNLKIPIDCILSFPQGSKRYSSHMGNLSIECRLFCKQAFLYSTLIKIDNKIVWLVFMVCITWNASFGE